MTDPIQANHVNAVATGHRRFRLGMLVFLVGYALAFTSAIGMFRIPLVATFVCMPLGLAVATALPGVLDSRLAFGPVKNGYLLVNLIGCLAIYLVLMQFKNSAFDTWVIHPGGFQIGWMVTCLGMFHFAQVVSRLRPAPTQVEIASGEYEDSQLANPYAPPTFHPTRDNE